MSKNLVVRLGVFSLLAGGLMVALVTPGTGQEPQIGAGPAGLALIGVFDELGFEQVPAKELMPGAPQKMKITQKTLAKLKRLMEGGKGVAIGDGGDVEIVDVKK